MEGSVYPQLSYKTQTKIASGFSSRHVGSNTPFLAYTTNLHRYKPTYIWRCFTFLAAAQYIFVAAVTV
jgi:hypothetical protein